MTLRAAFWLAWVCFCLGVITGLALGEVHAPPWVTLPVYFVAGFAILGVCYAVRRYQQVPR